MKDLLNNFIYFASYAPNQKLIFEVEEFDTSDIIDTT